MLVWDRWLRGCSRRSKCYVGDMHVDDERLVRECVRLGRMGKWYPPSCRCKRIAKHSSGLDTCVPPTSAFTIKGSVARVWIPNCSTYLHPCSWHVDVVPVVNTSSPVSKRRPSKPTISTTAIESSNDDCQNAWLIASISNDWCALDMEEMGWTISRSWPATWASYGFLKGLVFHARRIW